VDEHRPLEGRRGGGVAALGLAALVAALASGGAVGLGRLVLEVEALRQHEVELRRRAPVVVVFTREKAGRRSLRSFGRIGRRAALAAVEESGAGQPPGFILGQSGNLGRLAVLAPNGPCAFGMGAHWCGRLSASKTCTSIFGLQRGG